MKTHIKFLGFVLLFSLAICSLDSTGQFLKMSFSNAYSMLNGGSNSASLGSSSGSSMISMINSTSFNKSITVSYGIPIEIVMEWANLKAKLSSDIGSNPDIYNNSSDDVQQAMSNIAYGDFVKISDYNTVNVKLNFRFSPPKLIIYGSDEGDFVNNDNSSPSDPGVFTMPSTPVRGTKIFVIKK